MSIESARKRRTLQNNNDKDYMRDINNQTEQLVHSVDESEIHSIAAKEFKDNLRQAMHDDIKYTPCSCDICIREHKKFLEDEDAWLEVRYKEHIERNNIEPCSDEELDAIFAESGIILDRKTGRFELINK